MDYPTLKHLFYLHQLWLFSDPKGKKLSLSDEDLSEITLSDKELGLFIEYHFPLDGKVDNKTWRLEYMGCCSDVKENEVRFQIVIWNQDGSIFDVYQNDINILPFKECSLQKLGIYFQALTKVFLSIPSEKASKIGIKALLPTDVLKMPTLTSVDKMEKSLLAKKRLGWKCS